jgi:hypothetical protein
VAGLASVADLSTSLVNYDTLARKNLCGRMQEWQAISDPRLPKREASGAVLFLQP